MKKLSTLLLACFLVAGMTTSIQAQSPVSFGLKGGLNIADLTNTEFDTDTRTGFMGGVSLDINLPAVPFGIESGVYYSQKGTSYSNEIGTGTIKLDYLEVPVLARFNLGMPGPVTPHVLAGPYLGFNVNSEIEGSDGESSVSSDISDEIVSTDFGLLFGAGVDFNLGMTALNAQIRYGLGLTNVFEDDVDDDIKNGVFSIAVGVRF